MKSGLYCNFFIILYIYIYIIIWKSLIFKKKHIKCKMIYESMWILIQFLICQILHVNFLVTFYFDKFINVLVHVFKSYNLTLYVTHRIIFKLTILWHKKYNKLQLHHLHINFLFCYNSVWLVIFCYIRKYININLIDQDL